MTINCSVLCHAINFMIWTSLTALLSERFHFMHGVVFSDRWLRDFTSCMELCLVIDGYLAASIGTGRHICLPGVCLHLCSCLHNIKHGGMIMLHKRFQKHEAFADIDEKSSQGIFNHFMPLVA